jgi:hypothetical protein
MGSQRETNDPPPPWPAEGILFVSFSNILAIPSPTSRFERGIVG